MHASPSPRVILRRTAHVLLVLALSAIVIVATPLAALAGVLDAFTAADKTAALRTALTQAAMTSVAELGTVDGFLGNAEVKIPLPGKLQKAEKMLRTVGLGKDADALILAMNRAAEAAMPEARTLLVDSVKQMSVQDATQILTGGSDAATQYFRRTTSEQLATRFLPIVRKATEKVGVAQRYNELGGKAQKFGLVDAQDATIESYVTRKALDGLYLTMAKKEAAIRKDPLGQSNKLLQRIFGAIGR